MERIEHPSVAIVGPQPLRRPLEGRMVAGVAAGLAEYLDVDVVVVRITLAALGLMGGIGVPLYVAAWFLVPEAGAEETVAEGILDHLHHR